MSLVDLLTGDVAAVETYLGETSRGPLLEPERVFDCRAEAARKLVRNAAGDEVVSEVTLFLPAQMPGDLSAVNVFCTESVVTVQGRQSSVISVRTHRGLAGPVYVEVTLG